MLIALEKAQVTSGLLTDDDDTLSGALLMKRQRGALGNPTNLSAENFRAQNSLQGRRCNLGAGAPLEVLETRCIVFTSNAHPLVRALLKYDTRLALLILEASDFSLHEVSLAVKLPDDALRAINFAISAQEAHALHFASLSHEMTGVITRMLQRGVDPNVVCGGKRHNVTALMIATAHQRKETVQALLNSGADPDLGWPPPLFVAIGVRNVEIACGLVMSAMLID